MEINKQTELKIESWQGDNGQAESRDTSTAAERVYMYGGGARNPAYFSEFFDFCDNQTPTTNTSY